MTLTASATAGPSAALLPARVPATRDLTRHCEDFTSVPETLPVWLLGAPQTSLCTEVTGLVWVLRFPGMAAWVERSQVGGE